MMTNCTPAPTILILAGKRDGKLDPLAERAGVSHKAVVPIAGKPLIGHVLATASKAWPDNRIFVSIHDPAVIEGVEEVRVLKAEERLEIVSAEAGIVEAAGRHASWPLLITTADNVLTTPEAMRALDATGQARQADAVFGLARKQDIQSAHIEGQKGIYDFRDMSISNCNLFWLRDERALKAAEAFRSGGQFFKNRDRIRKAFGLRNLLMFKAKLLTISGAMERMSKRFGSRSSRICSTTTGSRSMSTMNAPIG